MSITLQVMTFSSLSPMRRLHYSKASRNKVSYVELLSSMQNMCHVRRNQSNYCLIRRTVLDFNRNVLCVNSSSSSSSRCRSMSSLSLGQRLQLSHNLHYRSDDRNHCREFAGVAFSVRHSSTSSKENEMENESKNKREIEEAINSSDNSRNSNSVRTTTIERTTTTTETEIKTKTTILNTENDKYFYLIKQKYSPSRHQKYRQNVSDGSLEKTVSNKP